ncbi:MAG: UDP-glucose/GDP-mannose dehydrogenase family protein [Alphaproteobacteria bacterium]|nr:UDP-glucose/GDP-mannose dehydrogenase family protein [Alphaproteobacteria bacterium]MDD9920645.1 UDP-glucose/GDP-mannose dehydrogenase family protein [Alphaproteobacteria bacterium]
MNSSLSITMIGTGYVGLVSGTSFAELGFQVTCVDIDAEKIRKLKEHGEVPIYEPGLEKIVRKNMEAGRLDFTTDLSTCVPSSDVVFIGVGTPQDEDGSADMKYVLQAAKDIAKHLQSYTVIVNKSTVPVGTGQRVEDTVREVNSTAEFDVVSNPEFLREGAAVKDFLEPDRVVVGVPNTKSQAVMVELYKPLTNQGAPLLITNRESSEIIKYAANAFLATKITFINEMAALCDVVGADIQDVSKGMGLDSRIGNKFLQPGPGYGGSCFPKDTNAIAKTAKDVGTRLPLVEATITSNQAVKKQMTDRIIQACSGNVSGKKIAILGLAFKAGTDDMRDASSLTVLPELNKQGANIYAYDPAAMPPAKELMPQLTYCKDMQSAVESADAVVILTEWEEFKDMDLEKLATAMKGNILIDLRNMISPNVAVEKGFEYSCIGRSFLGSNKSSGKNVAA